MIKRDLLITIDDPFGEPAMKLLTNDKGFVMVEMLEVNKNKFNIQELQTALNEIRCFNKHGVSALDAQYFIPSGENIEPKVISPFTLDKECNEINVDFTLVGKEG